VVLGIAAVGAIGAAVFFLGRGSAPTTGAIGKDPAVPTTSASATASVAATPPAPVGCPPA